MIASNSSICWANPFVPKVSSNFQLMAWTLAKGFPPDRPRDLPFSGETNSRQV